MRRPEKSAVLKSEANSDINFWQKDLGFVLFCLESCCLQKYDPILGYPATFKKIYGKMFHFFTFFQFFSLKYIYIFFGLQIW